MKVALINNQPFHTGVGRYAITIHNLLKNSIEIDHYFIDREKHGIYKNNGDDLNLIKTAEKRMLIDNSIFVKHKLSNLFLDYRVGRHISDDYDLYHITNQNMSILNYFPNIGNNIITTHDIIYFTYPSSKTQKTLSKIIYRGLKNSNFIISDSYSTKEDLINNFNISENLIDVIHLGVDNRFKPLKRSGIDIYEKYNLDRKCLYVLHIGENSPRKNFEIILKAFKILITDLKMNNVKLIKINEVDFQMIKKMGLEDYVIVIDNVPENDLPKIYNIADVFVFPSICEGFGLPLIEAMACGTPVIASNTTSIPEIVGESGILLDPHDFNGFSKSIYKVLTDENLKLDMINDGLKRVKKRFSWKKCAKNVFNVYKQVLE